MEKEIIDHAVKVTSNNSNYFNFYKQSELDALPDAPTEPINSVASLLSNFESEQIQSNFIPNSSCRNSNESSLSLLPPGKTKSPRKRSRRRIYSKPRKRNRKKKESATENVSNSSVSEKVIDQSFDSDCSSDTIILDDFEDIPFSKKTELKSADNFNYSNVKPPVLGKLLISSSMLKLTNSSPIVKKEFIHGHFDSPTIHHNISNKFSEPLALSIKKEPIDTDDQFQEPPALLPEITDVYAVNNNKETFSDLISSVKDIKKEAPEYLCEEKVSDLSNLSNPNNFVSQKQTARKRTAPRTKTKVIQNTQKKSCKQKLQTENFIAKNDSLLPSQQKLSDCKKSSHTVSNIIFPNLSKNDEKESINQNSKSKINDSNYHNKSNLKCSTEDNLSIPINKPSLILQSILEKHNAKIAGLEEHSESNNQIFNLSKSNVASSFNKSLTNLNNSLLKNPIPLSEQASSFPISVPKSNLNKKSKKPKKSPKKTSKKKGKKSQNLNTSLSDKSGCDIIMGTPMESASVPVQTEGIPPETDIDICTPILGIINDSILPTEKACSNKKRKRIPRKWTPKKKVKPLRIEADKINNTFSISKTKEMTVLPSSDEQGRRYSPEFDEQGVSCSLDFNVNTPVIDPVSETNNPSTANKQHKKSKKKSRKKSQSKNECKSNLKNSYSGSCLQSDITGLEEQLLEANKIISKNQFKSATNMVSDKKKCQSTEIQNKLNYPEKTHAIERDLPNIRREFDMQVSKSNPFSLPDKSQSKSPNIPSCISGFRNNQTDLQSSSNNFFSEPVFNHQNMQKIFSIKKEPDLEINTATHTSKDERKGQKTKANNSSSANELNFSNLSAECDQSNNSNVINFENITIKKEIISDDDCSIVEIIEAPSKSKPTKAKKDPILSRLEDIDIISNEILLSTRSETKRLRNELRLAAEIPVTSDEAEHFPVDKTPSHSSSSANLGTEIPVISEVVAHSPAIKTPPYISSSTIASSEDTTKNRSTSICSEEPILESKEDEQVIVNFDKSSEDSTNNHSDPTYLIKKEVCSDDEDLPLSTFVCKKKVMNAKKQTQVESKTNKFENCAEKNKNLNKSIENSETEISSVSLHTNGSPLKPPHNGCSMQKENLSLNSCSDENTLKKYGYHLDSNEISDKRSNNVEKITQSISNIQGNKTLVNKTLNNNLSAFQESSTHSLPTKTSPEQLESTYSVNTAVKKCPDLTSFTLNLPSNDSFKICKDVPGNSTFKHNTHPIVSPCDRLTHFPTVSEPLIPVHLIKKEKYVFEEKIMLSTTISEKVIKNPVKSEINAPKENVCFTLNDLKKVNENLYPPSTYTNAEKNMNFQKEVACTNKITSFSNCLNNPASNERTSHSHVDKSKDEDVSVFF